MPWDCPSSIRTRPFSGCDRPVGSSGGVRRLRCTTSRALPRWVVTIDTIEGRTLLSELRERKGSPAPQTGEELDCRFVGRDEKSEKPSRSPYRRVRLTCDQAIPDRVSGRSRRLQLWRWSRLFRWARYRPRDCCRWAGLRAAIGTRRLSSLSSRMNVVTSTRGIAARGKNKANALMLSHGWRHPAPGPSSFEQMIGGTAPGPGRALARAWQEADGECSATSRRPAHMLPIQSSTSRRARSFS